MSRRGAVFVSSTGCPWSSLWTASMLLVACDSRVGRVDLALLTSPCPAEAPLSPRLVENLRIRVDGPSGRVGPFLFALSGPDGQRSGVLDKVPLGDDQIVTVEGLGAFDVPRSRARSAPLRIGSGNLRLELFIGLLRQFSRLPAPLSAAGQQVSDEDCRTDSQVRDVMNQKRAFHSATALPGGEVLIAGGVIQDWRPERRTGPPSSAPATTSSVEIIDGNSLRFQRISCAEGAPDPRCLQFSRSGHSATLLSDGRVLIAGGENTAGELVAEIEIYDPQRQRMSTGEALGAPGRTQHEAARAQEHVFVAGGASASTLRQGATVAPVQRTVERFQAGSFGIVAGMSAARRNFSLHALADRTLVAVGGIGLEGRPLSSVEQLLPGGARWQSSDDAEDPPVLPRLPCATAHQQTVLLADGALLIVGGLTTTSDATASDDCFDGQPIAALGLPASQAIIRLDTRTANAQIVGRLQVARWAHTATLLRDNERILVTGGFGGSVSGSPIRTTEEIRLIDGGKRVQVLAGAPLNESRAGHTATLLPSGGVLIAGGITDSLEPTATAEVFIDTN